MVAVRLVRTETWLGNTGATEATMMVLLCGALLYQTGIPRDQKGTARAGFVAIVVDAFLVCASCVESSPFVTPTTPDNRRAISGDE